jgi:hypothetical protein
VIGCDRGPDRRQERGFAAKRRGSLSAMIAGNELSTRWNDEKLVRLFAKKYALSGNEEEKDGSVGAVVECFYHNSQLRSCHSLAKQAFHTYA